MKKNFSAFLMLWLPMLASAQFFNERIGTYKDQVGHSVQRTKVQAGFIVAGRDGQSVFGRTEASVVKTKPSGLPEWSKVYGGVGDDSFNSIREVNTHATLPVDGYAMLGTTTSFNSSEDLYFVRTDLGGVPIYSFTFGTRTGNEQGHCLQYIKDFSTGGYGYVMAGQTNSYSYYGYSTDILLVKTDENGVLTKAKVVGAPGEDIAYWIEQTRDGGFIITGSTTVYPGGDKDIFLCRLDKDFELIWQQIYRHCQIPYDDVGYGVVENPMNGTFTVTGFTKSFGKNFSHDAFLLNVDPLTGVPNWMKRYGTEKIEEARSIDLSSGGAEYVISGHAIDSAHNKSALVVKTDAAGNFKWANLYGAAADSIESAAEITNNGKDGYIFTGYAESTFTINEDVYLVNISHDGDSGGCQEKYNVGLDNLQPCLFSNFQAVNINDLKAACTQYEKVKYQIKTCPAFTTASSFSDQQPSDDAIAVIPNPSSTSVRVLFQDNSIEENGGDLVIYNRNGTVVHRASVTSGDLRIPVENFPDDIYMIRFTAKNGKQYQKKFIKK